jgi:hypothetical protein
MYITVFLGSAVNMSCKVNITDADLGKSKLKWKKKGLSLTKDGTITEEARKLFHSGRLIATLRMLTILGSKKSDSGIYTCSVLPRNGYLKKRYRISVTVKTAPLTTTPNTKETVDIKKIVQPTEPTTASVKKGTKMKDRDVALSSTSTTPTKTLDVDETKKGEQAMNSTPNNGIRVTGSFCFCLLIAFSVIDKLL